MFFILSSFFPFYFASSPKSENFKKMKKTPADVIILHKCTKNQDQMLCYWNPWDMAHDTCNCCFSFWAIFSLLTPPPPTPTPRTAQKTKFLTNEPGDHFTHVYQKLWLDDVQFLRYGAGQMDWQKKWHREVGAPPKNTQKFVKLPNFQQKWNFDTQGFQRLLQLILVPDFYWKSCQMLSK